MKKMTLLHHFSGLRRRMLWCVLIFFVSFVLGWYVAPIVQAFLTIPLINIWPDGTFLYTGLADGLMIRLSLASMVALLVVLPAVLWHLWAFVAPGLKKSECKSKPLVN